MRFQDKVVVVTGAAGGIGTAIATRFASEGMMEALTHYFGGAPAPAA